MLNSSACCRGGTLLLVFLAAGCSSSGTVSGKVSYKGETLGGGTVVFISPGKKTVSSTIAPDGSYSIANIPTGTVKISVETKSAKPTDPEAMKMGIPANIPLGELPPEAQKSMYGSQGGNKGKYVEIPDELGDPDKSGLTLNVTGGSQPYNIELK